MLKRLIFWEFPRASWQYDVVVALILAFIFLTPRDLFRDQPRIPSASSIIPLPADGFFVPIEVLEQTPENQRVPSLTRQIRTLPGRGHFTVTRIEPILNSEGELQGYMAFARP
ncbi:MAG TPA: hypothetical protein VG456_20665 [Candidatus Sulfopaludibacter sp.]|jgi:hypothetical protein|nr:hypothetical protein [Candidatus Sulfopaludibacter sp.]